jgi:hypothetical protein
VRLFGTSNFIQIYDNILTQKECDIIISEFEKSKKVYGTCGGSKELDFSRKKCLETPLQEFTDKSIISSIIQVRLIDCLDRYDKEYEGLDYTPAWKYYNEYNVQKYETEDDGFKVWHCEHGVKESSYRILAWMFYLNNAKSGTEFLNYPTVRAKMGRCVIWPASWTHAHKGAPNKGLKYIVTGWVSYI